MSRRWAIPLLVTFVVLALAFVAWERGWYVRRVAPETLSALLRPHDVVVKPDGPGPFPTAILFSGCDGVSPGEHAYALALKKEGWASVAVESFVPRGFKTPGHIGRICKGQYFWGRERAGDALVSLADIRKLPFVDPERIVLMGWSHGAVTLMDLLAQNPPDGLPTNLTHAPEGGFAGVRGVVLFYPYCGWASQTRFRGWKLKVPTLLLLAGKDRTVPSTRCKDIIARLREEGHDATLTVHTYPDVGHAFDQPHLAPGGPLVYAPVEAEDARRRVLQLLSQLSPPP